MANDLEEKTKVLAKQKAEYNKLQSSAVRFHYFIHCHSAYGPCSQPSISETTKDSELLHKDLEKLKIILERYEARRDKLVDQIAVEKVEMSRRSKKNGCLCLITILLNS